MRGNDRTKYTETNVRSYVLDRGPGRIDTGRGNFGVTPLKCIRLRKQQTPQHQGAADLR